MSVSRYLDQMRRKALTRDGAENRRERSRRICASRQGDSAESGFTLLELLVVIAIIAAVAAIVLPRLSIPQSRAKPSLVAFLEQQRLTAIEIGRTRTIHYDGGVRLTAEPAGEHYILPEVRYVDIVKPQRSDYLSRHMLARFYPDGTAILANFVVMERRRRGVPVAVLRIGIDPIHGDINYAVP